MARNLLGLSALALIALIGCKKPIGALSTESADNGQSSSTLSAVPDDQTMAAEINSAPEYGKLVGSIINLPVTENRIDTADNVAKVIDSLAETFDAAEKSSDPNTMLVAAQFFP